jgi:hypothetical protein
MHHVVVAQATDRPHEPSCVGPDQLEPPHRYAAPRPSVVWHPDVLGHERATMPPRVGSNVAMDVHVLPSYLLKRPCWSVAMQVVAAHDSAPL